MCTYLTRINLRFLFGVILFCAGLRSSFGLPVGEDDFGSGKDTKRAALETDSGTVTTQMSNPLNQSTSAAQNPSATANPVPQTPASTQINLSNATLSLPPGVYDLSTLGLGYGTLTVSSATGGTTGTSFLYSYAGRNVTFSASGSVLSGILLALNAKVNTTPGLIASGSVISKDGGIARQPIFVNVPDSGSSVGLFCLAGLVLALFRFGTRPQFVRRGTP